jgi:hypothetical protein
MKRFALAGILAFASLMALAFAVALLFCSCASAGKSGTGNGSAEVLELPGSVVDLQAVAVVDISGRDTLYRFTPAQVDSLRSALKAAFVSESLLLMAPSWEAALVLRSSSGTVSVALHYGNVLRVNAREPWSGSAADSAGDIPAPGVADLLLAGGDAAWLCDLAQRAMGKPPSMPRRLPNPPKRNPELNGSRELGIAKPHDRRSGIQAATSVFSEWCSRGAMSGSFSPI